jgi:1,4-dihydroxy-2-naphthoyl-CoA hydrolase
MVPAMSSPPPLDLEGTVFQTLGIRVSEAGPERVVVEMDVGPRVHQPMGLLHGGVSAVLAESAASIGSYMNLDPSTHAGVGIELNISHLRARKQGLVRAIATPLRRGRGLHVWTVDVVDEDGGPVAAARCTVAIRPLGPS